MKLFSLLLLYIFVTNHGISQTPELRLRLGLTGTGTSDEGLWYFMENQGLDPQVFNFKNSWGLGLDLDYHLIDQFSVGFHLNISRTDFQLSIDEGSSVKITQDHTSHNQLVAEAKYIFRPGKAFRPFIGMNTGILFTRDIRLTIRTDDIDFQFADPSIFGLVIGFDHSIGSKGWSIHFIVRGQSFEYTTEATSVTERQTLLDQVWWMNYNHLQIGVGKTFSINRH